MVERAKVSNGNGNSGDRVTVALRYPAGVILRLYRFVERTFPAPLGSVTQQVAEQVGEEVRLNGYDSTFRKGQPAGMSEPFGLTHNVSKEFMDAWRQANSDSELLKQGLLFYASSQDSINDQMRDHESIFVGLEPINPSVQLGDGSVKHHDPRLRSQGRHGLAVATATERT